MGRVILIWFRGKGLIWVLGLVAGVWRWHSNEVWSDLHKGLMVGVGAGEDLWLLKRLVWVLLVLRLWLRAMLCWRVCPLCVCVFIVS